MAINPGKYLLRGYLTVAVAGMVAFQVCGRKLWDLLAAVTVQDGMSWPLLLAMGGFFVLLASSVFFSAPTSPLFYIAAGYLFGSAKGTAIATAATVLGATAAYWFFRKTLSAPVALQAPQLKRTFLTLLLLRCSPWFPSALINVFCGMTRVPTANFLVATLFGTLPLVSVYTLTASRLRGPIDASVLRSPELLAALGVLSVISLIGFLLPLHTVTSCLRGVAFGQSKAE
jgi:uncharacterized membrane protein YdjX (TVP38/TMEM64 family)